jgi:hypothetical protein
VRGFNRRGGGESGRALCSGPVFFELDERRDLLIIYSLCAYRCVEVHIKFWYQNIKEGAASKN